MGEKAGVFGWHPEIGGGCCRVRGSIIFFPEIIFSENISFQELFPSPFQQPTSQKVPSIAIPRPTSVGE